MSWVSYVQITFAPALSAGLLVACTSGALREAGVNDPRNARAPEAPARMVVGAAADAAPAPAESAAPLTHHHHAMPVAVDAAAP